MTQSLVLAHAPADAARATEIAAALALYGYEVEASAKPAPKPGRKLVVLWSSAGARSPALRAAARKSQAQAGATIVRLDAAQAPASLGGAHAYKLPNGVGEPAFWARALSGPAPRAAASAPPRPRLVQTSRGAGFGVLAFAALALGVAFYASDEDFAARVNGLAGLAQAQASAWVGALKAHVGKDG